MTDPRDAFRPVDLLGVAPVPAAEGEAQASTPLAASFLLGLGVPEHAREAVRDLVLAEDAHYSVGDDGSQCWEWDAPGLSVHLSVSTDSESDATFRVASVQPEFVDGEVLHDAGGS